MVCGLRSGFALLLTALLLSGCGVRGSLDLPPEAKAERAAEKQAAGTTKPEHKPFILDGLLR